MQPANDLAPNLGLPVDQNLWLLLRKWHFSQGQSVSAACKQIEVTPQTYYRWSKEYGRLRTDQAKRLRDLERENGRLKKLVADQALDNAILREAASGTF